MTNQIEQKCATVALLGIPNAGKSTLINNIIGEKIAAVHRKPQTTRKSLIGIHTEKNCQLVLIDTPGLHESDKKLNKKMLHELNQAIAEADILAVLLEINHEVPQIIDHYIDKIRGSKDVLLILNKIDLPKGEWVLDPQDVQKKYNLPIIQISALKNNGQAALIKELQNRASTHPFFYDKDDLTTASYRLIAENCIMENVMEQLHQEIPYQTAVKIESYKEGEKKIHIKAVIIVNRSSHKGMVIGKQGLAIKKIRQAAERELHKLTGQTVTLSLFVKVDQDWLKNDNKVKEYF